MALSSNIIGAFSALDGAAITVRQDRCAKVRNRNVSCLKCAEACTTGCISLVDGRLTIDADSCVGCGTCATACPTCALEARNPSDAQLLNECLNARENNQVTIACKLLLEASEGLVDVRKMAMVVCSGRVEESLICGLVTHGVKNIVIACGACDRCAQKHGQAMSLTVAESARALLAAWGSDACVAVTNELPAYVLAEGVDGHRASCDVEAFFSETRSNEPLKKTEKLLQKGGEGVVEKPTPGAELPPSKLFHVMKDGTLPHFVPDRRSRLLEYLSALGEPQVNSVATRLWGSVVIDGRKCTSCRMCATFCPTGAIRKFDDIVGLFGVDHFPGDCVKCGSCHDICPENAIMVLDETKPNYLIDGAKHHFLMEPRPAAIDSPHQIVNAMRQNLKESNIFER